MPAHRPARRAAFGGLTKGGEGVVCACGSAREQPVMLQSEMTGNLAIILAAVAELAARAAASASRSLQGDPEHARVPKY
jgi:hypothetical protein